MSRDDPQAAVGAFDRGGRHARYVDVERIVLRRNLGSDLGDHRWKIFPLQIRIAIENLERGAAERRLSAAVENVAREANAQFGAHSGDPLSASAS